MTDESRHFMRFSHQHKFGEGWTGGYQFEKVSDDLYFSELATRVTSTSRLNLPQQANIAYSDEVWQFNVMAQQFQTLSYKQLSDLPYKRLPQVVLNGKKDWGNFIGEIKNQAVYFDLDESKNPISTSSGNLIRPTGARFSTYPSISFPMAKPYGYITPKVGVHYTQYNLNTPGERFDGNPYEESISRSLPIFSLDSGLTFERNTKVMTRPYTQTLEPRMFYVYIPYKDQSLMPRFDTGLADLNVSTLFTENQFSGVDRVNNANQVSLAVSTRMIDGETGQQRFAATLGQRFYFTDRKVGLVGNELNQTDLKSDIVLAATAKLRNKWNIDTAFQYNTSASSLYRSNITARYQPEAGKVLNLTYRYLNDVNNANSSIDQINISTQWPLGKGWYALGRWNYSIKDKNILEGLAGLEYDAGCWQSRFVMQRLYTATAEANYAFFYQLEFGGMASLGASPFRILSRNIPGYTSTSQIPENYRQDAYE
jgi:LPS-assembly protein